MSLRRSGPVAGTVLLTAVFVVLGLVQAARDAPTVDEGADLTAALVAAGNRDLRMVPEHGALFHGLSGVLPTLLADPMVPETDSYRSGAWFDYVDDLVEANDRAGRLDEVLVWFRVAPLLAGAATGWLLFALGRRLAGPPGGLVAAGLWFTTPYILGLSHLGSLDAAFAAVVAALVLAVVRDRERPSTGRAAVVAVVLGAALATRHSAVVLAPVALGFVVAHRAPDRRMAARGAAVVALLALLTVWGTYRAVDTVPVTGPPAERFDAIIATGRSLGPAERVVLAAPMPVEWKAGFAYLAITSDERPGYLLGHTFDGNRPWFFPVSAVVKLPLTAMAAIVAGTVVAASRWRRSPVLPPLVVVGGVLAAFLVVQPLALGLRLAVPVIALAMVLAAPLASLRHSRPGIAVLGLLAIGQVAATAAAHPTSLAWTPPPFSHGYRYASDSSIDFGQALWTIRDEHARDPFVAASLITPRGLSEPGGLPSVADVPASALVGRVAVGATPLTITAADELSWLRSYCPVDVLDGAVLVYRFEVPPDTRPSTGMPPPPCPGDVSRRR